METPSRRTLGRYAAAVAITAVAVLLRCALAPLLGDQSPYLLFIAAVMASAWIGGMGPGLVATMGSAAAGVYLANVQPFATGLSAQQDGVHLGLYVLIGVATSRIFSSIHLARWRAERQRQALLGEIQERRQAEAAVRESEQKYRVLAEGMPLLVLVAQADGQIEYANARWRQFTGLSLDQIQKGRWIHLIHPEDRRLTHDLWQDGLAAAIPFEIEYRMRRAMDGAYRWFVLRATPLLTPAGDVMRWVAGALDIEDRKRDERTVRSLLSITGRLNATLDVDDLLTLLVRDSIELIGAEGGCSGLSTPDGIHCQVYKRDGAERECTKKWPPMQGLPGWVLVQKIPYLTNDTAADPQVDADFCREMGIRSALSIPILDARREVLAFFELHNKRDGLEFTPRDRERLMAVSELAAPAIQNALAYRRLLEAEESLKEADRKKDEFLATLAHELRNPLAPIRNALSIIRLSRPGTARLEEVRQMMERQIQQMVRLIDDLLDVSRITRGKLRLQRDLVPLADVINSAIETSRPVIEEAGHELIYSLPSETVYLDADATRLSQVFANLLTNAAKFTDRGGQIRLSAHHTPVEVAVSVRDDGIGIPADKVANLFEMFTQLDHSLEKAQGGLGIGLTLSRRLVELHGGTIEVTSEGPGMGSEFTVRLPVATSRSEHAEPEPLELFNGDAPAQRILVADDNTDAARSLALMFEMMGSEVRTVHDGQAAFEAAGEFRPDVVFLDIGMPRLNGYEAASRIRQQPWGKDIFLVALTGWGQQEDQRKSEEAGFNRHVIKPASFVTLQKLLHDLAATS